MRESHDSNLEGIAGMPAESQTAEHLKLKKFNKAIKGAWIVGVASGTIALIIFIGSLLGYNSVNMIEVIFPFGLIYGMYKQSRICAITLFLMSVMNSILLIIKGVNPLGIIISLLFTLFFAHCVYGTFVYHKIINFKFNQ